MRSPTPGSSVGLRVCRALVAFGAMLFARDAAALPGLFVGVSQPPPQNRVTHVVIVRDGTRTVLSIQPDHDPPSAGLALVVPVPATMQKDAVRTLAPEVVARIDRAGAPQIVELWEDDPCAPRPPNAASALGSAPPASASAAPVASDTGIRVEASFSKDDYVVTLLGGKESASVTTWLEKQKYELPEGAEPKVAPYAGDPSTRFLVARASRAAVARGRLAALRLHYDAPDVVLPLRIGTTSSAGTQDVVIHVLARTRYEAANRPNVAIATNVELLPTTRDSFDAFYAALFDRTLAREPRAVVTEHVSEGPSVAYGDLLTLGADVLPSVSSESETLDRDLLGALGASGGGAQRKYYGLRRFVLTRLHLRYAKDALDEDLVLREAAPIAGGRDVDADGAAPRSAQPSAANAFQARYAIRHPWPGPVACASPVRGSWRPAPAVPAVVDPSKTALYTTLGSLVAADVPELGVVADRRDITASDASSPPGAGGTSARRGGCNGCAMGAPLVAVAAVVVALAMQRTRRKRATRDD